MLEIDAARRVAAGEIRVLCEHVFERPEAVEPLVLRLGVRLALLGVAVVLYARGAVDATPNQEDIMPSAAVPSASAASSADASFAAASGNHLQQASTTFAESPMNSEDPSSSTRTTAG